MTVYSRKKFNEAFFVAEMRKFLNLLKGTNGRKLLTIIRYRFLQN